jgi:hypothetical protein
MVKAGRKTIQKDGRELQGVGFTVSIRPGDNVESQFGLMVDTPYQWYKKYGDTCEEFPVGFVGSPEDHEALMACLLLLIQPEEPLRPLFVRPGQVAVAFVSRDGTVMKESNLKIESGAWHEAAQPRASSTWRQVNGGVLSFETAS